MEVSKKERATITLYTETAPGRMNTHMVLLMPRALYSK